MGEFNAVFKEVRIPWKSRNKEIVLERPNIGTEGAYARFLERRAVEFNERTYGPQNPYAYREAISTLQRDVASGAYSWDSEVTQKSFSSPICFREIIFLIVTQRQDQQGLMREQVTQFVKEHEGECVTAFWEELMAKTPTIPPQAAGEKVEPGTLPNSVAA